MNRAQEERKIVKRIHTRVRDRASHKFKLFHDRCCSLVWFHSFTLEITILHHAKSKWNNCTVLLRTGNRDQF